MRRNHKSSRAIFILECPWGLDESDSNRSSVLPFVEGIAKLSGDMEVYHANFYDKGSFIKALDCLCKTRFKNTLIYIAAHGYKKQIAGANLGDLLFQVGERSRTFNITGVMLGSCFVGIHTGTMESYVEGTNLKWCSGYASSCDWLAGTMIDCSILSSMADLDEGDFEDKEIVLEQLASGITPFSKSYRIGSNYNGKPVRLDESLRFVVQLAGKGQRARNVSSSVFSICQSFQVPAEELIS